MAKKNLYSNLKIPAKKGFHRMPDGTLMKGAKHKGKKK